VGPLRITNYELRITTLLLLGLLASVAAGPRAQEHPPASPPPDALLREGIDRLSRFLASRGEPRPGEVRRFLERAIAPYFDFAHMSHWAAGPYYRRLTEAQRAGLARMLTDLFLSALARNLGSYARPLPHVEIYPPQPGRRPNEVSVYARVIPLDGFTLTLDFRYYRSPEGWKIYDVAANGASAVAYYRGYFTELLRRHGPELFLRY